MATLIVNKKRSLQYPRGFRKDQGKEGLGGAGFDSSTENHEWVNDDEHGDESKTTIDAFAKHENLQLV